MTVEGFTLWEHTPGEHCEDAVITHYLPERVANRGAVLILAGGGYSMRARHEDVEYADFLTTNGYHTFFVNYRVKPYYFPLPLLDARRAMRFVRHNAEKYGYDKNKIAVMGSSAGGHLAGLLCNYHKRLDYETSDELDSIDYLPNAQILAYPVISVTEPIGHVRSGQCLLGEGAKLSPEDVCINKLVSPTTPPAFIWHTFADATVDVRNSLVYGEALKANNVPFEMHIFPEGHHGMGLATEHDRIQLYNHKWSALLLKWLEYYGW